MKKPLPFHESNNMVAASACFSIHINASLLSKDCRNVVPLATLPFLDSLHKSHIQLISPWGPRIWAGRRGDVIHSLTLLALTKWNEFSSFGLEEDRSIAVVPSLNTVGAETGVSAVLNSISIELFMDLVEAHAINLVHIDDGDVLRVIGPVTSLAHIGSVSALQTTLEQCSISNFILRNQDWLSIDSPIVLTTRIARLV